MKMNMNIFKKELETPAKLKELELIKPNGCIVSREIYEKKANIKWVYRDEPVNETDSGWRIFAKTDDKNLIIVDIDTVIKIEPYFEKVKDFPVGTDLELSKDDAGKYFTDNKSGTRLWL